jgi:DNA polymerase sigma
MSNTENVGLRTTQYIQQSVGYFPFLGDLVILFKAFLAKLDLNNAYKGTFFLTRWTRFIRNLLDDHRLPGV